jgi:hypothetical protein
MKTRSADIENAIRNLNGRINDYSEENLENKFCKGKTNLD